MEGELQATSLPTRLTLSTCAVDVATTPNDVVVTITGELDMADADRVGELLSDAGAAGKPIFRLDLAELTFADSSAVKAILLGAKSADEHGVSFEIANPQGSVRRLLSVTGLVEALTVIDQPDTQEGPNSL